jgi:hypothetical protein
MTVKTATIVMSLVIVTIAAGYVTAGDEKNLLVDGLYLGDRIHLKNLTVWPVHSKNAFTEVSADLITLADAQEQGKAEVRETGAGGNMINNADIGGTVGELVIENKGKKPILVLAGTLLKGGKQDRQVGQDFVIPPEKTVPVAAFCVEHGRWTATRNGKTTKGKFKVTKSLATGKVRGSGQYKDNQQEVWNEVAGENKKAGVTTDTGTLMATMENSGQKAMKRREKTQARLFEVFGKLGKGTNKPVGLAYAVDGEVREVRVFTHPRIFQRFAETLFSAVAVEADLAWRDTKARKKKIHDKPTAARNVVDLVKGAAKISAKKVRTRAGSVNKLRKGKDVWNSDCFENEKQARPATRSFMKAF